MSKICCRNKRKKLFIFVSLIVLSIDLVFVAINYVSSKDSLHRFLTRQSESHRQSFTISMAMTYHTMLQIASFVSKNETYNQLFLQGKRAVEAEGGGPGGIRAAEIRRKLLEKIRPGWQEMTRSFGVRQLHYHLGPGSLSFLRVHKPDKYGDRMDKVRYTVVDTNAEKKPRTGFETGRVYSGLRGVTPVWAEDFESGEKIHVGALEAGTSFAELLGVLDKKLDSGFAVLLTLEHVKQNMWEEQVSEHFGGLKKACNCFLEHKSRSNAEQILQSAKINLENGSEKVQLVELDGRHYAVFYFPLYDYFALKNPGNAAAGFVMMWREATAEVMEFEKSSLINIVFAVLGFLIVEAVLIGALKLEARFRQMEYLAESDGLTSLHNRRHFDLQLSKDIKRSTGNHEPLSLILCDIDYFKQFNDCYGHVQGDKCLQSVAKTLEGEMKRSDDYSARYGGEEFVMILPNTDLRGAVHIAENIRQSVQELGIEHKNSSAAAIVTVSLGVAVFQNHHDNGSSLIRAADHYLYLAKKRGRNRTESALTENE